MILMRRRRITSGSTNVHLLIVDETDLLAYLDLEFLRRLLLHAKKAVDKKNYNVIFVCTDGKRIVPRHPCGIFL